MKINYLACVLVMIFFATACENESPENVATEKKQDDEMVITPFGQMPKSKTFLIEEGYTTKVVSNELLKVETKSGRVVEVLRTISDEEMSNVESARTSGVDPYEISGNDIVWVQNEGVPGPSETYSGFTTNMLVPAAPYANTETLFLGTRFQIFDDEAGAHLVGSLQYGPSVAGGGWYWSYAVWKWTPFAVTYSTTNSVSPGALVHFGTEYTGSQYQCAIGSKSQVYISNPSTIRYSNVYLFLAGSPKTIGSYPLQYKATFTNITVVKLSGSTYTTLTADWEGVKTSSLGERIVDLTVPGYQGVVDFCFYGIPSGLNYPNNGVYPKTLAWNATPQAVSYEISYYTLQPGSGNRTNYTGTSTTSPFTFPFVQGSCSGCSLLSKVRAVYAGGVVSDWSYEYNYTFGY